MAITFKKSPNKPISPANGPEQALNTVESTPPVEDKHVPSSTPSTPPFSPPFAATGTPAPKQGDLGGKTSKSYHTTALPKKLADPINVPADEDKLRKSLIRKANNRARAAEKFMKAMRENSDKSDEDLLETLKPWLNAGSKDGGKKIGPDGTGRDAEKVLLAYRLRQRGLQQEHIADQMGVSVPMVRIYLHSAKEMLRMDPSSIDIPQQVGETMSFFTDIREMALMIASGGKMTPGQKLSAMRVALDCEAHKNDFLVKVGVYSPSVMSHFQALMMNQFVVPSNDAKENGMEKFFSQMSQDLMAASAAKKLQSIAQSDLPETEFKDVG